MCHRNTYDGSGIVSAGRIFYLGDANYNVTAVVGQVSGAWQVVERYDYTPYGVVTVCDASWTPITGNASQVANTILYTGMDLDSQTGLYYDRARYYDAGLERFINRDPIESTNLYCYCGDNPTNASDPTGERKQCAANAFIAPDKYSPPSFNQQSIRTPSGKTLYLYEGSFMAHFEIAATFKNNDTDSADCCLYRQFVRGHFQEGDTKSYETIPGSGLQGVKLSDTEWTEDVIYKDGVLNRYGSSGYTANGFHSTDTPGFDDINKRQLDRWGKIGIALEFKAVIFDCCKAADKGVVFNQYVAADFDLLKPYIVEQKDFTVSGTLNSKDVTWK